MKLFVGNLSFSVTEPALRAVFAQDGRQVIAVQIASDRQVGHARGYGYVTMATAADGEAAIDALNGSELSGRMLSVRAARLQPGDPEGS